MASVNRTALFGKIYKVLKKCYKPAVSDPNRTVMEHLLFACCLEDAHHEVAEEAYAAMVHTFFDWNEVRVTSISELSEILARLPDPRGAANRIKRILHAVFEATFSFDLEEKRKKNLGPTVAWLEKLDGTSRFVTAYVVQAALGGHSIPIDGGSMAVLRVLDAVTDKDVTAGVVPGLERAIAKSKGEEFGSLLHELGADFSANAYGTSVRSILTQIDPDAADRLPKRRVERPVAAKPALSARKAAREKSAKGADASEKADAAAAEAAAKKKSEKVVGKKKSPGAEESPSLQNADKSKKKSAVGSASTESKVDKSRRAEPAKKKSTSEGLSKRKPR
jgi:endonuclease III